jgi:antitoxin MazE
MKTRVTKWGNSLAVRIPVDAAQVADLKNGQQVELAVTGPGEIAIRAVRRKLSLKELVAGIDGKNQHDATDWGKAIGKESW